jgi:hypothetical protein
MLSQPSQKEAWKGEAHSMNNVRVNRLSLVATVVVLGSALAMAQPPAEESLTGTVTSTARITHQYTCQRNQTQQTCTLASVQQGAQFVLLVGDKPFVLEGNRHMMEGYAGGKATVTGLVANGHIQVRSVSDPRRVLDDRKTTAALR